MTDNRLVLAIPSKGRLMEDALGFFQLHDLRVVKNGHERGYRGTIEGMDEVEVAFLSASEIARNLRSGKVHLGITGEDLVREHIRQTEKAVDFVRRLDFGHANVVVAVPDCWLDVSCMADLEDVSAQFRNSHGRRLRVATKYMNLTRGFFAENGVTGYHIVESLGATEGTPTAGTAELIVDITSTGTTLKANHMKILSDGIVLSSQAVLVASNAAPWSNTASHVLSLFEERFAGSDGDDD